MCSSVLSPSGESCFCHDSNTYPSFAVQPLRKANGKWYATAVASRTSASSKAGKRFAVAVALFAGVLLTGAVGFRVAVVPSA